MGKVVKLIKVDGDANNNKYYNMTENSDGTFTAEYARVGAAKPAKEIYPMSKWETKYKEKTSLKKGYKDVTTLYVDDETPVSAGSVSESKLSKAINKLKRSALVMKMVSQLQSWAKVAVAENYNVKVTDVTQRQVDTAQAQLDAIVKFDLKKSTIAEFNKMLQEFYMTIPRKMKHVKIHLVDDAEGDLKTRKGNIISEEQNTLDVMAGQVKLKMQEKASGITNATEEAEADMLSVAGLNMEEEFDPKVIKEIKSMMQGDSSKLNQVFRVTNNRTQAAYNTQLASAKDKKTELFWHGSRNENWWSIISSGLVIRPSNAVHSGSMFGDGVYFATKFSKSYNYTSGRNSYYARGSSNVAVLAVYEVHVGAQKHIKKHNHDCYSLNYKKIKAEGFDSVYAHGGADLVNDEFIVYQASQSTIKYLITVNA